MTDCGICEELAGRVDGIKYPSYSRLVSDNKNRIYESANICVIPSYGPLNESHIMVVSKRHVNSFAELNDNEIADAYMILDVLKCYFKESYGKDLIFFESGAGSLCNHSGGCITHAHIHGVVYSETFEKRVFEEIDFENIKNEKFSCLDDEFGYIWYMSHQGDEYVKNRPMLPSQFLRYLYCDSESCAAHWNWRRDINADGMSAVIETYKSLRT